MYSKESVRPTSIAFVLVPSLVLLGLGLVWVLATGASFTGVLLPQPIVNNLSPHHCWRTPPENPSVRGLNFVCAGRNGQALTRTEK